MNQREVKNHAAAEVAVVVAGEVLGVLIQVTKLMMIKEGDQAIVQMMIQMMIQTMEMAEMAISVVP
ncbi:hypothetical protein H6G71_24780 [Arthrospira platensis FACHB-835]|nr:hypothetical protein [Arthrospira platensis FACHB-835]